MPNYASGNVINGGKKSIEAYSLYSPSHCYQYIINEPRIERENKLSPFDFATKISEHL